MKRILCKGKWGRGGIDTFESNVVSGLSREGFDTINYSVSEGSFYSEIYNRYRASRVIKRKSRPGDTIFIPDHTLMSFINPENVSARIIPYIHDIFPVTTNFSGYFSTFLGQKYVENIRKCEEVICNSKYVQRELRQRAGFTGVSKVIYQGVGIRKPEGSKSYQDRKYDFIYVGGMTPRKAEKELQQFASNLQDRRMVAVNRKPLDLQCEVKTGISDKELISLLDNSKYYLHPSFQEGFGRGAVEAQRRGVPVIARDNQINNEILGRFIDIEQKDKLIADEDWRELSDFSMRNSEKYKWNKTIEKIKHFIG